MFRKLNALAVLVVQLLPAPRVGAVDDRESGAQPPSPDCLYRCVQFRPHIDDADSVARGDQSCRDRQTDTP